MDRTLKKASVEEWLVNTTTDVTEDAVTVVRTECGICECLKVLLWLHQGSVLSQPLFIIMMDVKQIQEGLLWALLYMDVLLLLHKAKRT